LAVNYRALADRKWHNVYVVGIFTQKTYLNRQVLAVFYVKKSTTHNLGESRRTKGESEPSRREQRGLMGSLREAEMNRVDRRLCSFLAKSQDSQKHKLL
jgi:hypothetical protein